MNTTNTDTSWLVPGADAVMVRPGRGHAEPPRIIFRVVIDRVGKRDIVAKAPHGTDQRFRVTEAWLGGFRSSDRSSGWGSTPLLVSPDNPLVAEAERAVAAADAYTALTNLMDELRRDRDVNVAENVVEAAKKLAEVLRRNELAEKAEEG